MTFDDAIRELFQVPHAAFVGERKRLAAALKAAGDKPGGTRLGKLGRPPISAWAVNQLWWREREAFDHLLATAARIREGDLGGTAAHREALTDLRTRATAILADAGHGNTESTLRRIATTLSAIAATGTFDPDPPGALTADRDPPGFEAAGIGIPGLAASVAAAPSKPARANEAARSDPDTAERDEAAERAEAARRQAEVAEAAAARRREDAAKAKRVAERQRHEAALRTAKGDIERRTRELERLRTAVADAETALTKAEAIAADLEAQLAALVDD